MTPLMNTSKANTELSNAFLKACFVTFYADFLFAVLPRLCFAGFTLAQPLYLRRVVVFVGESGIVSFVRSGLIMAGALIFLGVAVGQWNLKDGPACSLSPSIGIKSSV